MAAVDVTALSIRVESIGIKEASSQLGGLSTTAGNAEKRVLALAEAMKKLNGMSATVNATTGSTAALTAALNALNNTLGTLNQRTTQADTSQRRHNEGMREAHSLARGLSGSMGALWLTYGNLAGMMAGLAVGAGMKAIFTLGKDIEHTLEGIRVKGMESVDSINKMREAILDLGSGIYGPQEVAKAFDTLVMAGLNAQQAMVAMKDALNLALIGGTTVEKAAFTLVQVGTALGYTAEGYSRIGDVIAKTAAVSMSSVESLSEAFKSGSVVGKLYGASIVDIGTAFAALSNLGIRGSAAGTSLKNMYKELAADSDKLKNTLNLIGLKPQNLKDVEGNFKPMLELFSTLDGALSKYTAAEQKTLLARMANERGMKSLVEILSLYRQKLKESEDGSTGFKNKLEQMNTAINESYGFMAQGAAAMALTVDSQFKSVKNTLETSLIKAFQDIQPQLSLVARSLKAAFNSPEFISGVQRAAMAVANFAVFLVNNADAVWQVVRAFLAFKAAAMVLGLLTGLAQAFVVLKTAMDLARISAIAFQASLGLIGLALAAGAALLVWWATKKEEAFGPKQQAALNYMDDFKEKLDDGNKQLEEQIKLMRQGATATEAYTTALQNLQMQKVKEQGASAIGDAETAVNKKMAQFTPNQLAGINRWNAGDNDIDKYDGQQITALKELTVLAKNLARVKDEVKTKEEATAKSLARSVELNKELAIISDAKAKEAGRMPGGTDTIAEVAKKAAINDAMNKELSRVQAQVEAAKKAANQAKEDAQSAFKQGNIGELAMIERIRDAELERQAVTGLASIEKINILRKYANQESAIAQEQAAVLAAIEASKDAKQDATNKRAEFNSRILIETYKAQAEAYLANGQFVEAFKADEARKHELRSNQLIDSYNRTTDEAERFNIMMLVFANEEAKAAGIKVAANKEAEASFNLLADATKNAMKGIQTGSEGQGLAGMWEAAQAASAKYLADLPILREAMSKLTNPKDIEEAQARMTNLAETQKKMWGGVGESISASLENAFGKGGKAAADLFKIAQNYNNLENKSGSARVKAYGDAAGAAKNFFKEGTTGYKILEGAEKAFRAIEIAGMIKSLIMTGTTEAGKQAFKVPTVLMEFMAQMGPWGMAAGAAAIAAIGVAAFGGSGGGGENAASRQKSQGTGSVLGSDEKSNSIANSIEILSKNSGLGLAQGSSMVNYLKIVSENISGLAAVVVGRNTGITSGPADKIATTLGGKLNNSVFGGNRTTTDSGIMANSASLQSVLNGGLRANQYADVKKDGGWFRSDKTSTQTSALGGETNVQFTKIIESMAESIKAASKNLGLGGSEFNKRLSSFVVDIGRISLKGLSGDAVQKELEAVFSKVGDDMAKFSIVGLSQFQKIGEGYLETVMRVANSLIQVKDVFAVLGKSFDLTGVATITVSEGLIAAAGGLDKLTEGTKFYVDNFLSEMERMGPITNSVNKRLAELNIGEVKTIELFNKKIRALDLTNKADQQLYAAMLELAPAFKEAADYAADLANGVVKLSNAQQKALDAVNKAKDNLQKAYDKESGALQGVIDKTKAFITTLKNYQDSLKLGADSPLTNMQKYAEARKQFDATVMAAKGGDQAAKDKLTTASGALLAASKVINASGEGYTSDFNLVQTMLDQMIGSATSQVDVATASLNALNKQVEGLLTLNDSVMSVTQAIFELKQAIILGSAAGLTNKQMETTYIPTANDIQVMAPTSGAVAPSTIAALVGTVERVVASVDSLRAESKEGTSAVVGATFTASLANAENTIEGFDESVSKLNRKTAIIGLN